MGIQGSAEGVSPDGADGASLDSISCWLYGGWHSLGSADEGWKGEGPAGTWESLG